MTGEMQHPLIIGIPLIKRGASANVCSASTLFSLQGATIETVDKLFIHEHESLAKEGPSKRNAVYVYATRPRSIKSLVLVDDIPASIKALVPASYSVKKLEALSRKKHSDPDVLATKRFDMRPYDDPTPGDELYEECRAYRLTFAERKEYVGLPVALSSVSKFLESRPFAGDTPVPVMPMEVPVGELRPAPALEAGVWAREVPSGRASRAQEVAVDRLRREFGDVEIISAIPPGQKWFLPIPCWRTISSCPLKGWL